MPDHQNQWLIDEFCRGPKNEPNGNGHHEHAHSVLSDDRIIELCRKAKNAAKFVSLFDDGAAAGYGSASEADLALLSILAFYTQDAEQLDRLYRRSALYRQKWERHDYRTRTIHRALEGVAEIYSWPKSGPRDAGTGTGTPNSDGTGTVDPSDTPNGSDNGYRKRRLSSTPFSEMPAPEPRGYVVEGIIPAAYPTMIYGDGGVAKSLVGLSLGLAVSSGAASWLGHKIKPGGVLYLDFELDAPEQTRRVWQLASAEGLNTLPGELRYMSAVGVRAREAFGDALAECKEYGISLLIVDSLGPALEGDAEASRDVIAFYNEVIDPFRAADVAPLVIDHQSKLQAGERYQNKRAFGSVFKSNLARSVIQMEATERKDGELTVRLRQNKHNFGALLKPFGARLRFTEERISVEPVELGNEDLAEEATLNAHERVRLALGALGEGTRSEIHEQVSDLSPGTVKKELGKLCASGAAEWTGAVRDRQQVARLIGTGTGIYKGTGTGTGEDHGVPSPLFDDIGPEDAKLVAAGWKPKDRGDNSFWLSPSSGFAYSREMALKQLERDRSEGGEGG